MKAKVAAGAIIAVLAFGLITLTLSRTWAQNAADSDNLAKFVAVMQYIRDEPTPSDVDQNLLAAFFASLDTALSDIYITGFITPFTGETPEQVEARLQSVPEEDRFTAVMVESYRLASDHTLLDLIHALMASHYVDIFIKNTDLSGASAYLKGADIESLADAFDPTEYAIPAPSVTGTPQPTPVPVPVINAPQPAARDLGVINIAIWDVAPGVGLGSAQLTDAMHYWGVGEVTMKFVHPGVVAPMLAESWELDLEGGWPIGATLQIRDDVIFHGHGLGSRSNNGGSWGPMTAADIAFTINDGNGAINRNSNHWQANDFAVVFGNNPAVGVDDTTLQLTFAKDAEGNTLYDPRWAVNIMNDAAQSFSVQSLNRYNTVGETEMKNTPFIGTGPLHIIEWTQDETATLEPVPYNHWNANSKVDRIVFTEIFDQNARVAAMRTGEVDAAPIPLNSLPQMLEGGFKTADNGLARHASVVFSGNLWETEHVLFGTRLDTSAVYARDVPWVGNPNDMADFEEATLVRNALARAIDRERINQDLLHGIGHPVHLNQFSPNNPNWQSKWEYPYDPEAARDMLARTGYPNGFEMPLYAPNPGGYQDIADAIAGYWGEIGVQTSVQKFAYSVYRPGIVARATTLPWVTACDDGKSTWPWEWPKSADHTSLTRGGFSCGLEIPEVANTWIAVAAESDSAKQIALNNALADYLYDQAVSFGVVGVPGPITYNPNKIADWPMDPALFSTWNNPEDIVPAR